MWKKQFTIGDLNILILLILLVNKNWLFRWMMTPKQCIIIFDIMYEISNIYKNVNTEGINIYIGKNYHRIGKNI
jgi:hypothetical protein